MARENVALEIIDEGITQEGTNLVSCCWTAFLFVSREYLP